MKNTLNKIKDSWITSIIISVIIAVITSNFVVRPIMIEGNSMYPTYKDNSIGLAGKMFNKNSIERYDVVVAQAGNKKIIKRVIGLPGEKVEYRNHELYINGERKQDQFENITEDFTVVIPEGEYFILGDNRTNSSDSRYYGPFKYEQIYAKNIIILWPIFL